MSRKSAAAALCCPWPTRASPGRPPPRPPWSPGCPGSAALGVTESAVKNLLHTMRQRYRCLLRDEVAHTVENPAEIQGEIRYLCAALAAATE